MSSKSFSFKSESEAIEFTNSPSPSRRETADLISHTALAAVVCLKTGANAHRLILFAENGLNQQSPRNGARGAGIRVVK